MQHSASLRLSLLALLLVATPLLAAAPAPDKDDIAPPMEAVDDLVEHTSRTLAITRQQAQGGLGALFSHARARLSEPEFHEIARVVNNMQELLAAAPASSRPAGNGNGNGLFGARTPAADDRLDAAFSQLGLPAESIRLLLDSASRHIEGSSPTAAALLRQAVRPE